MYPKRPLNFFLQPNWILFLAVLFISSACSLQSLQSTNLQQTHLAIDIAKLKTDKKYKTLEKKLEEKYTYYRNNKNLMGHLFYVLDMADFYSYGFIDYDKALQLYAEARKINEQLRKQITPKGEYIFKGKPEFFFLTKGEFTFRRKYNYKNTVEHINKKHNSIFLTLGGNMQEKKETIAKKIENIQIAETGNPLNIVTLPSKLFSNDIFLSYEKALLAKIRQYLDFNAKINTQDKLYFENYNMAVTLFKSFNFASLLPDQVNKISFYIKNALEADETKAKFWSNAYLNFLGVLVNTFDKTYIEAINNYKEMTDNLEQLIAYRKKLNDLLEKEELIKNFKYVAGALAMIVGAGSSGVAIGSSGAFSYQLNVAGTLGNWVLSDALKDHVRISRKHSLIGESEYSKKINVLLNLDEQLLLFSAMGESFHKTEDIANSIFFDKQAIDLIGMLRSTIQSEKYRITFAKQKDQIYNQLINSLMAQGEHVDAYFYSESSRSRAFIDLLASKNDIQFKNQKIGRYISEVRKSKIEISQMRNQIDISDQQVAYINKKFRGILLVNFDEQTSNHAAGKNNIALDVASFDWNEVKSLVTAIPMSIGQTKKELKDNTALIEWYSSDEKLYVWIITNENHFVKTLAISSNTLKQKIALFRSLITNPELNSFSHLKQGGHALYKMLFNEITPILKKKSIDHVIIVPHGPLHFIPFEAFFDGEQFLVENYAFSYLPSASVATYLKKKKSSLKTALFFGNPKISYDSTLSDLFYAEKEAIKIKNNFKQNKIFIGSLASETNFYKHAPHYDVVHIASHGLMDPVSPLHSRIFLAMDDKNDGMLTTKDLYSINLNATLVTLSACETGLSGLANGDELIGLVRGIFFAGVRSFVSSLWEVDDRATMKLMINFYNELNNGHGISKALQLAKNKLIQEADNNFVHPFFWSAFIHYGV